jgi:uncharacterized protein YcbX
LQALCYSCKHQQLVPNTRGSVFSLCRRSRTEPDRFPRYPRMPVLSCVGYEAMSVDRSATDQAALAASATAGPPTVTALSICAVKGMRLQAVESIMLGRDGARGDRRFFVVDERDRMVNGKQLPALMTVKAEFDEDAAELCFEFPDGSVVSGAVAEGATINARAYGEFRAGTLLVGPWADALSDHIGRRLRIVHTVSAVDRGTKGAVSLVSQASLARLAEEAELDAIDARRFRMLIEIDGVSAHAEDQWIGRELRIGDALLLFVGHVGRCLVTSRDPEHGELTLPTLDLLRAYRSELDTTEPLAFGIHGRVLGGGAVSIGDRVEFVDRETAAR